MKNNHSDIEINLDITTTRDIAKLLFDKFGKHESSLSQLEEQVNQADTHDDVFKALGQSLINDVFMDSILKAIEDTQNKV